MFDSRSFLFKKDLEYLLNKSKQQYSSNATHQTTSKNSTGRVLSRRPGLLPKLLIFFEKSKKIYIVISNSTFTNVKKICYNIAGIAIFNQLKPIK
jgi:hypothetical protein